MTARRKNHQPSAIRLPSFKKISELSFVRALHGAFEVNERIPSVMNQRRIDSAVSTEMHLL